MLRKLISSNHFPIEIEHLPIVSKRFEAFQSVSACYNAGSTVDRVQHLSFCRSGWVPTPTDVPRTGRAQALAAGTCEASASEASQMVILEGLEVT